MKKKIAIIGAGIAGLTLANLIKEFIPNFTKKIFNQVSNLF